MSAIHLAVIVAEYENARATVDGIIAAGVAGAPHSIRVFVRLMNATDRMYDMHELLAAAN